ncbi:hypothetical protein P3T18_006733 [Paraburkholderia sp. GAS199]
MRCASAPRQPYSRNYFQKVRALKNAENFSTLNLVRHPKQIFACREATQGLFKTDRRVPRPTMTKALPEQPQPAAPSRLREKISKAWTKIKVQSRNGRKLGYPATYPITKLWKIRQKV